MLSFASFQRCVSSLPFSKSYQCLFYDSSYEPYKPSVMMRGLPDEEGFVPIVFNQPPLPTSTKYIRYLVPKKNISCQNKIVLNL